MKQDAIDADLVVEIERFLAAQKPLEPEFADILNKHLSDLIRESNKPVPK